MPPSSPPSETDGPPRTNVHVAPAVTRSDQPFWMPTTEAATGSALSDEKIGVEPEIGRDAHIGRHQPRITRRAAGRHAAFRKGACSLRVAQRVGESGVVLQHRVDARRWFKHEAGKAIGAGKSAGAEPARAGERARRGAGTAIVENIRPAECAIGRRSATPRRCRWCRRRRSFLRRGSLRRNSR